jgi:isopenicillin N synthase-like dioxygenase
MSEDYPYGYENCEALGVHLSKDDDGGSSTNRSDSKETFSIGPQNISSGMPLRRFPSLASPSFEETLTEYYSAMESLARILFRGLALALNIQDDYFLRPGVFDSSHQCALRILNYPPSTSTIRAGAHTDYGAMTILLSGGPGLQLYLSGEWIDVPHIMLELVILYLGIILF